jgi:hypothetical protein
MADSGDLCERYQCTEERKEEHQVAYPGDTACLVNSASG